jgi:hypothetical protein
MFLFFTDDVGDQLCERVLGVLYEIWLIACVKSFPNPTLWKTFREMCMNWRHRTGITLAAVFRIHDVLIRIRIRGSVRTTGLRIRIWIQILLFLLVPLKMPTTKKFFVSKFFCLLPYGYLLLVHLYLSSLITSY